MKRIVILAFITWIMALGPLGGSAQEDHHVKEYSSDKVASAKAPEVYTVVEQAPEYPGGSREMFMFIQKNIQYPQMAKEFSGKVYIKMVVDTTGKVSDVEVLKGCKYCPECDAEAVRVISSMSLWKPGIQNGRKVRTYYNIPINFHLQ